MTSFSNERLFSQKTYPTQDEKKCAFLISTYDHHSHEALARENLAELERLADTYGLITVGKSPLLLREISASTYLSKGKLEEVTLEIYDCPVPIDVIIFDEEIHPGQQRNLEKHFSKPVIDRAEVILGVFAQRAQTKEAQLQIELAQLEYQAPRLKRLWTHLSRQSSGGGGFLKGEGEKQIEIDRRLIKSRMQLLRQELEKVRQQRTTQRKARLRYDFPIFSIIGYTNAGKSTLLRALTDADVLVEDKLFATLDTTTRRFRLPSQQEILLVDTVGFIRKLPHLLVDAFRSTLEESLYADYLLHLVDASHPFAQNQMEATLAVLDELNIKNKPILTLLNKIDQCQESMDQVATLEELALKMTGIKPIRISASNKTGFNTLLETLSRLISQRLRPCRMSIPQTQYHLVASLVGDWDIVSQEYQEDNILLAVRIPPSHLPQVKQWIIKPSSTSPETTIEIS
jgi:GTP-binding protein HflX